MKTILIVACECHQPDGVAVYRNKTNLITDLRSAYGSKWANSAHRCTTAIEAPDAFDIGDGYWGDLRALVSDLIEAARTLDDLVSVLRSVIEVGADPDMIDWCHLPNFGGDAPDDTIGVLSFDKDSLLVGSIGEWRIISRTEWVDHPVCDKPAVHGGEA